MSNETRIDNLEDSGRFLFIYSDKFNVFLFFWHLEKRTLYKITTDKYLEVEYVDEVTVPENFQYHTDIKFFKPYSNNNEHTFIGIVNHDGVYHKFTIETDRLTYKEKVDYAPAKQFNVLLALKDIEVKAHIQKRNKLFIVGEDRHEDKHDAIYGVLNLETDSFEQVYYIYSDKGDVRLETVNIDTDDLKVYVGGYIIPDQNEQDQHPFIESFLLRK